MKNKIAKFSLASLLMLGTLAGCDNGTLVINNGNGSTVVPNNNTKQTFRITYDANGGSGSLVDLNEYESGTKAICKENTFTAPAGKEFSHWSEEKDGSGSNHKEGSSLKVFENVTLYAIWVDEEIPDDSKEHNINVTAPTGVNYTLSATKAFKDTVISLTISLTDGVLLNGDPTSKQVTIAKKSDLNYEFTMPATTVAITIKATMNGDVVLVGDINAKLEDADNDGIYTAEVELTNPTYSFSYMVKDSSGSPKKLSSLDLDESRCDANITFANGEHALTMVGGAKYVFSYDSNADGYNCFVTRKQVNVLPTNGKTLYNLFDGKMRSQSTIHPQGLTSIHYEKTVSGNDTEQGYKKTNEVYDYKKISDNESFAISQDKLTNTNSYVYKNIDDVNNVYSIINTYTVEEGNNEASDNVWTLDPYGDMQGDRYRDYSARQDIVDNSKYRDTSRYQITTREATRNVNMAAHYGSALEYEIWKSIRGDFDGTAVINAANAAGSHSSITSVNNNDGTFTVKIDSQLEYNHEESGSTADVTQVFAYVYKNTMEFDMNGDLISMDYKEDCYNKDNWNFAAHAPAVGGIPTTVTIKVINGFDEIFNRASVLGTFNPSDYFVSSIQTLKFYNPKAGEEHATESVLNFDDDVLPYDYLGGEEKYKLCKTFDVTPSTALDKWQYGFISSTDKGIIDDTVYGPKTVGIGSATATFGNHLQNMSGPTIDVKINVYGTGTFHGLFVNANITGYDSWNTDHADYMYGYAGKTMKYYIDSSSNTGCPVSYWMVIKEKDEDEEVNNADSSVYFNVVNSVGTKHDDKRNLDYKKMVGHDIILDFNTPAANALTSQVQIDVIFRSDYYETGYGPSTLHIVVGPARKSVANCKFEATYLYKDSTAIYEKASVEFYDNGTGKITEVLYSELGAVTATNVFNFSYTEHNNGSISAVVTSVVAGEAGIPTTAYSYNLVFEMKQNGVLGVCLYTDDADFMGMTMTDGDGYTSVVNLDGFTKVVA